MQVSSPKSIQIMHRFYFRKSTCIFFQPYNIVSCSSAKIRQKFQKKKLRSTKSLLLSEEMKAKKEHNMLNGSLITYKYVQLISIQSTHHKKYGIMSHKEPLLLGTFNPLDSLKNQHHLIISIFWILYTVRRKREYWKVTDTSNLLNSEGEMFRRKKRNKWSTNSTLSW